LPLTGRPRTERRLITALHAVGYVHCGDWLEVP
jgi:hypothetical protein